MSDHITPEIVREALHSASVMPHAHISAMAPDLARAYLDAMEENARLREAAGDMIMAHPKVQEMVKALEWYAEKSHWLRSEIAWSSPREAVRDKGDRARAVLRDLKGGE